MNKAVVDYAHQAKMTQVVVIAGGRAKRMGLDIPKCLLPLLGKTLVDLCVDSLVEQGFSRFVFLLGYKSDLVLKHLKNSHARSIISGYSIDPKTEVGWGKGKAFKSALLDRKIDSTLRSLVVFPDDVIMDNCVHQKLLTHHLHCVANNSVHASILLVQGIELPYGVAEIGANSIVTGFVEKPVIPYSVSAGVYIFEPPVYDIIKDSICLSDPNPVDLESTIIPKLVKSKKLSSFSIPTSDWLPINTVKEYEKAVKLLGQSN